MISALADSSQSNVVSASQGVVVCMSLNVVKVLTISPIFEPLNFPIVGLTGLAALVH